MTKSRHSILRLCLSVGLAALVLSGCKPTVPRQYIQPKKMENLLYDYHLAMAMAASERKQSVEIQELQAQYRQKVFEKYGITQADFDKSMVYYYRHADRLTKIYKRLGDRFSDEASSLGINITKRGKELPTTGDTANVWKGKENMLLMPYRPHNLYAFHVKADTAWHKGDRVELNFNVAFIYQDGPHDATAYIVVRFRNDSTTTQMRRINSTSDYSMVVNDDKKAGIKEVKGYFIMPHSLADQGANSFRVIYLSDINLVRTHPSAKPVAEENKPQEGIISSGGDAPDLVQAEEGAGEKEIIFDDVKPTDNSKPRRAKREYPWEKMQQEQKGERELQRTSGKRNTPPPGPESVKKKTQRRLYDDSPPQPVQVEEHGNTAIQR